MAYMTAGAACVTSLLMLPTPAVLVSALLHSPIVSSRGSATEYRIRHGVGGKGMQMHRNGRFQPDTQDQAISHQARRIRPRPRWATHLRPIGEAGPSSDVPADEHATSTTMCNGTTRISVCDKCGEFEVGDRPELDVSGIERGRGSLALCNAPGCGQTFAQCPQCERDYGRYCSTACRTLYLASTKQQHNATEQGHPAASRRDTDAGIINGTVKGQLRRPRMATMPADSGELEGPALLGGEVKEADTSNEKDGMRQGAGGDGYRWEGRTTGVAVEVTTGLSKGNFHTGNKRQKNRDFSVPEAALATSALEGLDGPAADPEPYASRHSTPESPRLAHVREATDRSVHSYPVKQLPVEGSELTPIMRPLWYSPKNSTILSRSHAVDWSSSRCLSSVHADEAAARVDLFDLSPSCLGYKSGFCWESKSRRKTQPGGAHMVSGHLQGELLKLLTRLCGAKRVLDVGTFTGYSALAFAEALPEDGEVITLESEVRAAETAKGHFKASPHGEKIELRFGQAMDSIEKLIEDRTPPFDVIFIDADKKRYWDYYEKALAGPWPLLAPAGILLADNVLFHDLVPLAEALGVGSTPGAENGFKGSSDSVRQGPEKRLKRHEGNSEGHESVPGVPRPQRTVGVSRNVTPRRLKIAKSLDGFNKRVADDDRVEVLMLPLRDGLSVVRWKKGRYPHPSQ